MLPRLLQNFNAYIDGENFMGRVTGVQLPELSLITQEHRGGGMDAALDNDMGMEKLDVSITLAEYSETAIAQFGNISANTQVTLRGSIRRQGEIAQPVEIRCVGMFKTLERDEWQTGQNSAMTITANCNSYIEVINGRELINIDVLNGVRIIDGVDRLADQRANLGI